MTEFTDLITIAEMTPGPIAINSATFVGTRIAGLGGALISTFGCVLPSFIILLGIVSYNKAADGIVYNYEKATLQAIEMAGEYICKRRLRIF